MSAQPRLDSSNSAVNKNLNPKQFFGRELKVDKKPNLKKVEGPTYDDSGRRVW